MHMLEYGQALPEEQCVLVVNQKETAVLRMRFAANGWFMLEHSQVSPEKRACCESKENICDLRLVPGLCLNTGESVQKRACCESKDNILVCDLWLIITGSCLNTVKSVQKRGPSSC